MQFNFPVSPDVQSPCFSFRNFPKMCKNVSRNVNIFVVLWCCACLAVNTSVRTCAPNTVVATAGVTVSYSSQRCQHYAESAVVLCLLRFICVLYNPYSVLVVWLLSINLCSVFARNKHTAPF